MGSNNLNITSPCQNLRVICLYNALVIIVFSGENTNSINCISGGRMYHYTYRYRLFTNGNIQNYLQNLKSKIHYVKTFDYA